jgi:hypothetical protein
VIAVLTHPRPGGVSYLGDTLASIDRSARGRRVVISDVSAHRPELPPPWELEAFDRPASVVPQNKWALWRGMRIALEAGEDLVTFEDDVLLCRNGAVQAETLAVPPDVAWLSLYDPWFDTRCPHGLWRSRALTFMYAQAMKFPLRSLELLLLFNPISHDRTGADDLLASLGRMLGLTYAVHVPSIAQHVGAVSAVGNGDLADRTSRSFRADYNPLTEDRRTFL